MARYVKLATIAPEPPRLGVGEVGNDKAAVERMQKFWRGRLNQVWPDEPDLVLVPEACDRFAGQSANDQRTYYQARGDSTRDFFADQAREHRCYIAYSAVREMPDGTWRNSTQLLGRGGNIVGVYSKNHVVIEETTQGGILCGKDAPIFDCDFGRVACAICFDLNFQQLRDKYIAAKPDLLLFSSMYHGGLMQNLWAYACRTHFMAAVPGEPSAIISPIGEELATTTNYFDFVTKTINLDCAVCHLDYNWGRLSAMRKKYGRKVKVLDPGHLGSVLVSSECDEFSVQDLLQELELEVLDDYMTRALAHHNNPENIEP
jgi:predicted amidohydrolase